MTRMSTTWGPKVRERRTSLRMTQADLAAKTGLTQATISRIEKGHQAPRDDAKFKIAAALQLPVDYLFAYPTVVIPESANA